MHLAIDDVLLYKINGLNSSYIQPYKISAQHIFISDA